MFRRAAHRRHRDMRHRRFRGGPVPVFFPGLDMHHVANSDVPFFGFGRDLPLPCRDNENLIAVVHMPPGRCADTEINHVAAKVLRLSVADNRLPRPAHRPARPTRDRRGTVHGFFLKLADFEYAHFTSPVLIASVIILCRGVWHTPSFASTELHLHHQKRQGYYHKIPAVIADLDPLAQKVNLAEAYSWSQDYSVQFHRPLLKLKPRK